jgi:hypothetical protein
MNINTLSDAQYMNPSTGVFVEQILRTVNSCSLLTQSAEKQQQQQQQQHSLLSQANWGRLEMKPKRDEK